MGVKRDVGTTFYGGGLNIVAFSRADKQPFYSALSRSIESAQAEPFATRREAGIASFKERGTMAVSDDNGGRMLAPRVRAYNAQELQDAGQKLTTLNAALDRGRYAPATPLSDAPTGSMVGERSLARMFGFNVTFIQPHKGFDGVAFGGQPCVSASTKHPEIGLIGHEAVGH